MSLWGTLPDTSLLSVLQSARSDRGTSRWGLLSQWLDLGSAFLGGSSLPLLCQGPRIITPGWDGERLKQDFGMREKICFHFFETLKCQKHRHILVAPARATTASVLSTGLLTLTGLCHAHTLPLHVHIHS